jgi:hypothetical protein
MDLSPVNSFRLLFNTYFNTELKLLPNQQYFSTSARFYDFIDVTGQSQNACNLNSNTLPGLSTPEELANLAFRDVIDNTP